MNTDFLPVIYLIEALMGIASVLVVGILAALAVDGVRRQLAGRSARDAARRDLAVAFGRMSAQS